MKGYKAFNKDLKCRDFQYEIGQTYEMDGEITCCERGFHFCKNLTDCYKYYDMSDETRICEIEALGEIKTDDAIKYCTSKIKILSEVKNPRIKSNVNKTSSGYCNTGSYNNGDYNSGSHNNGDRNSGDYNRGDFNIGDWNNGNHNSGSYNRGNDNSGCWNAGHCNSGNHNSGDANIGYWNSGGDNIGNNNAGYHNTGNHNSGDWNKGNHNVGIFNCKEQKIRIFDKKSNWTMRDWKDSKARVVMLDCPCYYYNYEYDNDQKTPKVPVIREVEDITNIRQKWWDKLSEEDKNAVKSLPNFDADKFYLCTGIRV